MELNEITSMVQAYREILLEEWGAIAVFTSYGNTVQNHKATAIAEGYKSGIINGKNVNIRSAQEDAMLEADEAYQMALDAELNARNNMKQLEIERKCVETRISLMRAWLYSQSSLEAR